MEGYLALPFPWSVEGLEETRNGWRDARVALPFPWSVEGLQETRNGWSDT